MNRKRITIQDIAGFYPEEAVWKMMADVSAFLEKDGMDCILTPDAIIVDVNTFIVEPSLEKQEEFLSPELNENIIPGKPQMVWAIGAVAYYMSTGHVIFCGHGGEYQMKHPSVPLPVLPKGKQALKSALHQCVCFNPQERISLEELNVYSLKRLSSIEKRQRMNNVRTSKKEETEIENTESADAAKQTSQDSQAGASIETKQESVKENKEAKENKKDDYFPGGHTV